MDAEISPQLLVNIFVPKTPLHDGAIVISGGRIKAAACMLPLAGDKDIARELGTRHRASIRIIKRIRGYCNCCIRRNRKSFNCKRPEHLLQM